MRVTYLLLIWVATTFAAIAQEAAPALGTNAIAVGDGGGYVLDDKHQLEPGDKVSFRIIEDRDPAISLVVTDSRELDVPYVGRVSVAKMSCKTVAANLKVLLEKEYYHQATVILGLDMVNKVRGKVYVWGQVRTQGPIDLLFDDNLTAGKAILRAGGFGDFANKRSVKVIRNGKSLATIPLNPSAAVLPDAGKPSFEINMIDVLEKGKTDKDILLEPDDFIVVPSRSINF
jgi:polysaccharide biosynthesis/export protein